VVELKGTNWALYDTMVLVVYLYYALVWLGFSISFLIYGQRLTRLMSGALSHQAKKVISSHIPDTNRSLQMTIQLSVIVFVAMIDKILSAVYQLAIYRKERDILTNMLWGPIKDVIVLFFVTGGMLEVKL